MPVRGFWAREPVNSRQLLTHQIKARRARLRVRADATLARLARGTDVPAYAYARNPIAASLQPLYFQHPTR
jgi:hypothetical protein